MKGVYLFFCICLIGIIQAQVPAIEFQSERLNEEKIRQIIETYRKQEVQKWELKKLNASLHKRLKQEQLFTGTAKKTIIPPAHINSSACINPGFENGTAANWALFSGDINGINLPCDTCASGTGAIDTVINNSSTITGQCNNGLDHYGGFPVIPPSSMGGNYALLLNDTTSGGKIMKAAYIFIVDSTNDLFSFQYAIVLNTGGTSHTTSEQPYFHVEVTDSTTGSVISCTEYEQAAPASGPLNGWNISPTQANGTDVYYKPWTTETINLEPFMGHTVAVNFIISDCNLGGHFGYCYIDASCGSPVFSADFVGLCHDTGIATIIAPGGYGTYQWYGPNDQNLMIAGDTMQALTTTAVLGDTFYVAASLQQGCVSLFKFIVDSFSVNISNTADSINVGDSITLRAHGATTYVWNGSDGSNYAGSTVTVSPLFTTTYTVTGTDSSGCSASASRTIYVSNQGTFIHLTKKIWSLQCILTLLTMILLSYRMKRVVF